MPRLNLTLDSHTLSRLERYAERVGKPRAGLAREMISEGLSRRAAAERQKKWARDYQADRADSRGFLEETEFLQLEVMGSYDE